MELKTEEQLQKEREAVDAMRNAKSNMDKALARIQTLENALKEFGGLATSTAKHIPDGSYLYKSESTVREDFKTRVALILKVL
jgi:hypothetical protein